MVQFQGFATNAGFDQRCDPSCLASSISSRYYSTILQSPHCAMPAKSGDCMSLLGPVQHDQSLRTSMLSSCVGVKQSCLAVSYCGNWDCSLCVCGGEGQYASEQECYSAAHYRVLLDSLRDAVQYNTKKLIWSVRHAITELCLILLSGCNDLPVLDEDASVEAIQSQQPAAWTDVPDCPCLCQSHGVKDCTYYRWFMRPSSCASSRSYQALPLPGKDM
jgi:hypothetical protein